VVYIAFNKTIVRGDNIWLSTRFSGVIKINTLKKEMVHYTAYNSGLKSNLVKSISVDGKENLYVATVTNTQKFNGQKWTDVEGIGGHYSSSYIHKDKKEGLLVFGKYYAFRLKKGKILNFPKEFHREISDSYKDKKGNLYFIGGGTGLVKIRKGKISQETKIGNQNIDFYYRGGYTFKKQEDGGVIFGGHGEYVELNKNNIEKRKCRSNSFFTSNGEIWNNNKTYLNKLDSVIATKTSTSYYDNPSFLKSPKNEFIKKAFFDKEDNLYVITFSGCYRKKKDSKDFENIVKFNQFLPNDIATLPIKISKEGRIWMVSKNRLHVIQLNENYKIDTVIKEIFPFRISDFITKNDSTIIACNKSNQLLEISLVENRFLKLKTTEKKDDLIAISSNSTGNGIWLLGRKNLIQINSDKKEIYHPLPVGIKPLPNNLVEKNGKVIIKSANKAQLFEFFNGNFLKISPPNNERDFMFYYVDYLGRIYSGYPNMKRRNQNNNWSSVDWIKSHILGFKDKSIFYTNDEGIVKMDLYGNQQGIFKKNEKRIFFYSEYLTHAQEIIYLMTDSGILLFDESSFDN